MEDTERFVINPDLVEIVKLEKLVSENFLVENYAERNGEKDRIIYAVENEAVPVAYVFDKFIETEPCTGCNVSNYIVTRKLRNYLKSIEISNEELIRGINKLLENSKYFKVKQF